MIIEKPFNIEEIEKMHSLFEGLGFLPREFEPDILQKMDDKKNQKIKNLHHMKYYLLDQIEGLLIAKNGARLIARKKFSPAGLRKKLTTNNGTIYAEIFVRGDYVDDFFNCALKNPKSLMMIKNKYGIDIDKKPVLLNQFLAMYIYDVLERIIKNIPYLQFSSFIELQISIGEPMEQNMSLFKRYKIRVPISEKDISDFLKVLTLKSKLEETRFYNIFVHELMHIRDFISDIVELDMIEEKQILEFTQNFSKQPTRQLLTYGFLIWKIKSEGYATFGTWVNSSFINNALYYSPQAKLKNKKLVNQKIKNIFLCINDLADIPLEFKKIFFSSQNTQEFNKKYNEYRNTYNERIAYFMGALIYSCLLIYFHKNDILQKEMCILTSKKRRCTEKDLEPLLGNFWKFEEDIKEKILEQNNLIVLEPSKIMNVPKSNYIIIASPKIYPKITNTLKLLNMSLINFYIYGKKACEFCGFKEHIFWSENFIHEFEKKYIELDSKMI